MFFAPISRKPLTVKTSRTIRSTPWRLSFDTSPLSHSSRPDTIVRQGAQEHDHLLRLIPLLVPLRQPEALLILFELDLDAAASFVVQTIGESDRLDGHEAASVTVLRGRRPAAATASRAWPRSTLAHSFFASER